MSRTRNITMTAVYLFFHCDCILVCEIYFSIDGDTPNEPPHGLAKGFNQ